ncbi:hypothetical protein Plhal304r1_c098g0174261 [Plasmopara halstedii]
MKTYNSPLFLPRVFSQIKSSKICTGSGGEISQRQETPTLHVKKFDEDNADIKILCLPSVKDQQQVKGFGAYLALYQTNSRN